MKEISLTLTLFIVVLFFPSVFKNTVSSPGWFIGQKGEEKPRMRTISFPTEEGRDWIDQGKREEKINEHLKVQEKETITENNSLLSAEKKEWRYSIVVSQQGKKEADETEEAVIEKAESQQMEMDGVIMYDPTSPKENKKALATETVPSSNNGISSEN